MSEQERGLLEVEADETNEVGSVEQPQKTAEIPPVAEVEKTESSDPEALAAAQERVAAAETTPLSAVAGMSPEQLGDITSSSGSSPESYALARAEEQRRREADRVSNEIVQGKPKKRISILERIFGNTAGN